MSSFQKHIGAFEEADISVSALSNDPVETIAQFAAENAITYTMLSDSDSAVINEFGILNTLIRPDEDRYGIAYPGVYVIGPGRTRGRENVLPRVRRTRLGGGILKSILGDAFQIHDNPRADAEGPGRAHVSGARGAALTFMQQIPLYVWLELDEGHMYGTPVPDGFTPPK